MKEIIYIKCSISSLSDACICLTKQQTSWPLGFPAVGLEKLSLFGLSDPNCWSEYANRTFPSPVKQVKVASKQLTTMRRMTRSQSRLMCSQPDEVGVGKRASFSNLTNLKSPKRRGKRQKTAHKSIQQPGEAQAVSATQSSGLESQSTLGSQLSLSQQPVSVQNGELLQTLQTLRKVLENDFSDVSGRLQLPTVPSHLYKSCHSTAQLHFASAESVYVAKNYFTEDRHVEFISLVAKSMCGQKQFPGALVARCILETILVSGDQLRSKHEN